MKKLLARVASEVLYCVGDWVSRPMSQFDWAWLYPVYSWLMIASSNVQDWAGNDQPWGKIKEKE
jgi:hypothetical protein